MKKNYHLLILSAVLALPLVSCNLFTKTVKTEKELPTDRVTVAENKNPEPYRSSALDRGEISGEWAIKTVNGHEAEGEMDPFLLFDPQTGRVYGNNGCNTINGDYNVNPSDSTLTFTGLLTTMRLCAHNYPSQTEINLALDKVRRYTWTFTPELFYSLDFLDESGNTLMTLQRQDFDFLNGTWRVSSIKGVKENNEDMVLVFDIAEQKLHGNTGCNVVNGQISIDMGEHNSITLQNLLTTRMACPDNNSETALLVALEEVMYARPINSTECQLINGQGDVVLTLVRVQNQTN